MLQFIKDLYPLNRTLASDDMYKAIDLAWFSMPEDMSTCVIPFEANQQCWTWKAPGKWSVHEAYLRDENGKEYANFDTSSLCIWSYSCPVDTTISWVDLQQHLAIGHGGIPWKNTFYSNNWGFCISHDTWITMPKNAKYTCVIDSNVSNTEGIRIVTGITNGPLRGELMVMGHLCHPAQVNDGLAGVAVAIEVAHRISELPMRNPHHPVRFLFGPETIGTIAYLSSYKPNLVGGIFIETPGLNVPVMIQESKNPDDRINKHICHAAGFVCGSKFREGLINDELVLAMPGIDVPAVSIARYPYLEYHTSRDNLDITHGDKLVEVADIVEKFVRSYCEDYIPVPKFSGPVFLSGYGLWDKWCGDQKGVDLTMAYMDGKRYVSEIAKITQFRRASEFVRDLYNLGLVGAK
jgi:aminopeptidase-like protein